MKNRGALIIGLNVVIGLLLPPMSLKAQPNWSPLAPVSLYQVGITDALSFKPQRNSSNSFESEGSKRIAQVRPPNSGVQPGAQPGSEKTLPQPSQSRPSQPSPTNESIKAFKEWQLKCYGSPVQRCELSQQRHDQNTKQLLYWVELSRSAADNVVVMTVVTPLGIGLKDGIIVSVDNVKIIQAAIVSCLPVGCMARIAVDQTVLDRLSQGRVLSTSAVMLNGQPLNLGMPLDGFSDGYIALAQSLRAQRKR